MIIVCCFAYVTSDFRSCMVPYCPLQDAPFQEEEQDPERDFACFPTLPFGRRLPKWGADTEPKAAGEREDTCNKSSSNHPSRTPGIFCLFCPHGFSLGFAVMHKKEGVSTFFNILYCRLPKPPKMIIYDNGCNLHVYTLARAPNLFRLTKFVVDKFHIMGHVGYDTSS